MAWYKQPIRPLDPVIEDDPDSKAIRYYISDFKGTGQDSFTQAPAQDQSLFQKLSNVMPPVNGVFRRRWGISTLGSNLTTPVTSTSHMYSYQSDLTLARKFVLTGLPGGAWAANEDGTVFNNSIFTTGNSSFVPRMVTSRSTGYFCDGQLGDNIKWDGSASGGTSKWGIDVTANSVTGPTGPKFGGTATDIIGGGSVAWTSINNILADDGAFATATFNPGGTFVTHIAQATNFAFALTGPISGIKVEVKVGMSRLPTTGPNVQAFLYKGGIATGVVKAASFANTAPAYLTFGSGTDLWGTSWAPSDINAANFGVGVLVTYPNSLNSPLTINLDAIRVTVYSATNAITFTSSTGNVTLSVGGRTYYYAFKNSITGHYSDLSVASSSTGNQTSKQFSLTLPQPAGDSQIDTIVVLGTADGNDPTVLFQVAEVPVGTTSFVDNIPEATLLNNQVLQTVDLTGTNIGLALNTPPPAGTLPIKHKGRLFMAVNQTLFFSKSVDELTLPNGFVAGKYEEAWPQVNFLDISEGAETIQGLLSDGNNLYIGTQAHVRVLFGDGPTTFQKPEIVHQHVGVLNQEVWNMVYVEGTPLGAMWLTPDFRVIGSDFNTYTDAGTPIQDVLNSITPAAAQTSFSMFVADGEFDLFMLWIPTNGDLNPRTVCVFDLRGRRWQVWNTNQAFAAGLYNITAAGVPQWLVTEVASPVIGVFTPNVPVDSYDGSNPTPTSTVQTSWLHFGMPTTRKMLNDIGVVGDVTDGTMLVTVEGADTQADFLSPHLVATKAPVLAPFGSHKVFLAGNRTKYRYYRITVTDSSSNLDFLHALNVKVIPINTL